LCDPPSSRALKDLLGLAEPTSWGPFLSLTLDDGIRFDHAEPGVDFPGQHQGRLRPVLVYFDDPSGHHFELITQPYGADR
jgi:hypothetical protein